MYLRANATLRDDMREWRSALNALFEATPLAARMLLALASGDGLAAFSQARSLPMSSSYYYYFMLFLPEARCVADKLQ